MKDKIINWFKDPQNIIILLFIVIFLVIGIIDNNLIFMFKLFLFALILGLLIRFIFYLKDNW